MLHRSKRRFLGHGTVRCSDYKCCNILLNRCQVVGLAIRKFDGDGDRCCSRGSEKIEPEKKVERELLEWTMLLQLEVVARIEKAEKIEKSERIGCRR